MTIIVVVSKCEMHTCCIVSSLLRLQQLHFLSKGGLDLFELLLARPMGQYCFACWRLSSSVTLPAGGSAAGRAVGRAAEWADTSRRASSVTSR